MGTRPGVGPEAPEFTVQVIEDTGERETVFVSSDRDRVSRWVRRWLDDHLGMPVVVVPPKTVTTN